MCLAVNTLFSVTVLVITASLSEPFETPMETFVKGCKKDQLVEIANHYGLDVTEKRKVVLLPLFKQNVLKVSVV